MSQEKGPFEVMLFAGTQGQTRATLGEYGTLKEAQDYINSLGGDREGARYKIVPKPTGYEVVADTPPTPAPTVVSKHATLAEAQAAVVKLNNEGKGITYRVVAKYPPVVPKVSPKRDGESDADYAARTKAGPLPALPGETQAAYDARVA